MPQTWIYSFIAIGIVSLASLLGVLFLALRRSLLDKILTVLVAFAAGGLLGASFFHILPESFHHMSGKTASLWIVGGFMGFFVLEKTLHWHHNHSDSLHDTKVKVFGPLNLMADLLHNFLDGILIAAAFKVDPHIGWVTTFAVLAHEIPQEIGDFGVLVHAGFSRKKALALNFLSACAAFLGGILMLTAGHAVAHLETVILPLAAGGFIYIAAADLIPELHSNSKKGASIIQFVFLVFGLALLYFLSSGNMHQHAH